MLYRQALELDPAHAIAWLNLGLTLRTLGHREVAYGCMLRAQELSPDDPIVLTNLGNVLLDLYRLEEAMPCHDRAVALKPDDIRLVRNRIIALREVGRFEEMLSACEEVLRTDITNTSIQWERAQALFYMQRYEEAWEAFDHRWQRTAGKDWLPSGTTFWQGEELNGKSILVYEEQGFGDKILCSRYIPLLAERGAKVTFICHPSLHALFSALPARVTATVSDDEQFHHVAALMSLPRLFGTNPARQAPPPPPPLTPSKELPAALQQRLDAGAGRRRIGIVWSGNPEYFNNYKRAVPVERFIPLAQVPGVQLYSLQKGPFEGDLERAGANGLIIELGPLLGDFAQTAAVIQQLDLIIMTDTGAAHLAGSLGRPVWNLLHYRPYWLYGADGASTPWYPSMRLFRQDRPGDWDSVFTQVREALQPEASG